MHRNQTASTTTYYLVLWAMATLYFEMFAPIRGTEFYEGDPDDSEKIQIFGSHWTKFDRAG